VLIATCGLGSLARDGKLWRYKRKLDAKESKMVLLLVFRKQTPGHSTHQSGSLDLGLQVEIA